jgi:hypothetical protein
MPGTCGRAIDYNLPSDNQLSLAARLNFGA